MLSHWERHYPLLSTGSTKKDPSRHDPKIVDLDQTKLTNLYIVLLEAINNKMEYSKA